jgi:hypothetical protein
VICAESNAVKITLAKQNKASDSADKQKTVCNDRLYEIQKTKQYVATDGTKS